MGSARTREEFTCSVSQIVVKFLPCLFTLTNWSISLLVAAHNPKGSDLSGNPSYSALLVKGRRKYHGARYSLQTIWLEQISHEHIIWYRDRTF